MIRPVGVVAFTLVAEPVRGGGGGSHVLQSPPPRTGPELTELTELRMSDQNTPLDDAAEHAAEAVEQVESAVSDAVEEIVEAVAEPVAEASTTATEAATEAATEIEDQVETVVTGAAEIPNEMMDEVYSRVMQRLRDDGHISSAPMVEEIAGEAENVAESAVAAPEVVVDSVSDTIAPRREHWYTRPRKFMGREW